MTDFLLMHYEWLRALHILSFVSWMAGMLYLPRLFVYHAKVLEDHGPLTPLVHTFEVMERRLLRFIMNPAMVATWIFGLGMLSANPAMLQGQGWMHAKLLLVILMSAMHGFFAKCRKDLLAGKNTRSSNFFRVVNEIPTVLMIGIVFLAVLEPF